VSAPAEPGGLTAVVVPSEMTAAAMVREQVCSAVCLVANPVRPGEKPLCDCPCRGAFHGALGAVVVPESAAVRPDPPPAGHPTLFDIQISRPR
jgi:hypothetical protein